MLEAAVRVAQIACGLNPDLPEQTAATRGADPFHHVGGGGQSVLQGIEERAPGLIGRRAAQRLPGGASVPEIAADEGAFDLVAAQDGTLGGVYRTRRLALRKPAAGRTLVSPHRLR